MNSEQTAILDAITQPLADAQIAVEDVRVVAAGVHRTVTVTVDLLGDTVEPVSLDTIAAATRLISEHIDPLPLFNDHPYNLEVTSPGADRQLTAPRHFARVVGRSLVLRDSQGTHRGELIAATGEHIVLRDATSKELTEFPYEDIEHATVELKFR